MENNENAETNIKIATLIGKATNLKKLDNQTTGEVIEGEIDGDKVRFTRKMADWEFAMDAAAFAGDQWFGLFHNCIVTEECLMKAWDNAILSCQKNADAELGAKFAIVQRVLNNAN